MKIDPEKVLMTGKIPDQLDIWTVYKPNEGHLNEYVARRSFIQCGAKGVQMGPGPYRTEETVRANNLITIREAMMNKDLVRIERNEEDDPSILETWI